MATDYRQQSGGTLGIAAICPTCYVAVTLYYSALGSTDLCCNVSSTSTYYVLASEGSFANATVVYSNQTGTVAPDGYYKE